MTMRGFLACYLGAVAIVGITGASAYHGLQRRHEATQLASVTLPAPVAEAPPPAAAPPAIATMAATEPKAVAPAAANPVPNEGKVTAPWPRLRPHVVARAKPRPHVTTDHAQYLPPRFATEPAQYLPPPPPSPPPMAYGYAYPPPYPGYGSGYYPYYYVRYGYYRSF
jgi:hypothetical protein